MANKLAPVFFVIFFYYINDYCLQIDFADKQERSQGLEV